MLAQREKKEKGKEGEKTKGNKNTCLSLLLQRRERKREREEEKWMGKRETRKIKRRAENVEMYCVLKSFCPLSSRNVILFRRELTCDDHFILSTLNFSGEL